MSKGQIISVSPQSFTDEENKYCYLFIENQAQSVIGFVWAACVMGVLIFSIRQFSRARKLDVLNSGSYWIYALTFAWAGCTFEIVIGYLCKIVLSEFIYWKYHDQDQADDSLSMFSKYIFGLDFSGAFFVQAILIMAPKNMQVLSYFSVIKVKELLRLVEQFQQQQQGEQHGECDTKNNPLFERKTKNYERWSTLLLQKIIRIYRVIRITVYTAALATWISIAAFGTVKMAVICTTVILFVVSCESILVLGFVIYSHIEGVSNPKLEDLGDNLKQVKASSLALIGCSLIRCLLMLAFSSYYTSQTTTQQDRWNQCKLQNPSSSEFVLRLVNIILEGLFMHVVPIFVAISQFKVEGDGNLTDSLLAAEQSEEETKN